MTSTNVAATNPSLLRAWWMNKNLRYDVTMGSIVLFLNIEAIMYMITHEFPYETALLPLFSMFYILFGLGSCMCWVSAIKDVTLCEDAFAFGVMSHIFGLGVFLQLLYYISPQLALFVGLNFGLVCLLWFVTTIIGPNICSEVLALPDWWKSVNEPGRVIQ